jgi:8-oxo-dGTP pyrophosphatase MutT (NUDIX family)
MRLAIRERLAPPPSGFVPVDGARRSDFDLNPGARAELADAGPIRNAAVLIPIIDRPDAMTVLFTRRTEHLANHAGQVSFPGGRAEDHDEGPVETALRETEEEVGLDRALVDVAGALSQYETGTRFLITPIVGIVRPEFTLRIDPNEVAEVFEVPLAHLLDPANQERRSREWRGKTRNYFQLCYEGHRIWGATAGIVVNLSEAIRGIA